MNKRAGGWHARGMHVQMREFMFDVHRERGILGLIPKGSNSSEMNDERIGTSHVLEAFTRLQAAKREPSLKDWILPDSQWLPSMEQRVFLCVREAARQVAPSLEQSDILIFVLCTPISASVSRFCAPARSV